MKKNRNFLYIQNKIQHMAAGMTPAWRLALGTMLGCLIGAAAAGAAGVLSAGTVKLSAACLQSWVGGAGLAAWIAGCFLMMRRER